MINDSSIKVILADDHRIVRRGIISLFEKTDEVIIIDDVESGEKLIDDYFRLKPDVLLVDIRMPGISGIEAVRTIKSKGENARVLFISMYDNEANFYSVVKAGGKGLIGKDIMEGQLLSAIKDIYNDLWYFNGPITECEVTSIIKKYESRSMSTILKTGIQYELLTDREIKILALLSEGMTRTEIAGKLFISRSTYDFHKNNIMLKFNLTSLPALVVFAVNFMRSEGKPDTFSLEDKYAGL